jgi:hypothetical protein
MEATDRCVAGCPRDVRLGRCLMRRKTLQNTALTSRSGSTTSGYVGQRHRLREFLGTSGFLRGFPRKSRAGCARDEKKPAVVYAKIGNKRCDLQELTGATGLEPATSGVTGRYGATGHSRLPPGITC